MPLVEAFGSAILIFLIAGLGSIIVVALAKDDAPIQGVSE